MDWSKATQGLLWEQAADSKFRLMMALAVLGKVLPTVKSDLHSRESDSLLMQGIDYHKTERLCCLSSSANLLQ